MKNLRPSTTLVSLRPGFPLVYVLISSSLGGCDQHAIQICNRDSMLTNYAVLDYVVLEYSTISLLDYAVLDSIRVPMRISLNHAISMKYLN